MTGSLRTAFPHPVLSGVALLLYLSVAVPLIWFLGFDSHDPPQDSFLYLLNSQAQVLGTVIALVFSATLIVAQMAGRYTRRLADPILGWWLLWYLGPFLLAILIPLFLLNGQFLVTGVRLSLLLGGGCILLVVFYFDAMRKILNTGDALRARQTVLIDSLSAGNVADFHALIDTMAGAARNNDLEVARIALDTLGRTGIADAKPGAIARTQITSAVAGAGPSLATYPGLLVEAEKVVRKILLTEIGHSELRDSEFGDLGRVVWDLFAVHTSLNRLTFGHDAPANCVRMLEVAECASLQGHKHVHSAALLASSESILALREQVALSAALRTIDHITEVGAGQATGTDLASQAIACLFAIYRYRDADPILGSYSAGNIRACCETLAAHRRKALYLVAVENINNATRRTQQGWRSSEDTLADEMIQALVAGLPLWKSLDVWSSVRPAVGNIVEIVSLNSTLDPGIASRISVLLESVQPADLPKDCNAQSDIVGWLRMIPQR